MRNSGIKESIDYSVNNNKLNLKSDDGYDMRRCDIVYNLFDDLFSEKNSITSQEEDDMFGENHYWEIRLNFLDINKSVEESPRAFQFRAKDGDHYGLSDIIYIQYQYNQKEELQFDFFSDMDYLTFYYNAETDSMSLGNGGYRDIYKLYPFMHEKVAENMVRVIALLFPNTKLKYNSKPLNESVNYSVSNLKRKMEPEYNMMRLEEVDDIIQNLFPEYEEYDVTDFNRKNYDRIGYVYVWAKLKKNDPLSKFKFKDSFIYLQLIRYILYQNGKESIFLNFDSKWEKYDLSLEYDINEDIFYSYDEFGKKLEVVDFETFDRLPLDAKRFVLYIVKQINPETQQKLSVKESLNEVSKKDILKNRFKDSVRNIEDNFDDIKDEFKMEFQPGSLNAGQSKKTDRFETYFKKFIWQSLKKGEDIMEFYLVDEPEESVFQYNSQRDKVCTLKDGKSCNDWTNNLAEIEYMPDRCAELVLEMIKDLYPDTEVVNKKKVNEASVDYSVSNIRSKVSKDIEYTGGYLKVVDAVYEYFDILSVDYDDSKDVEFIINSELYKFKLDYKGYIRQTINKIYVNKEDSFVVIWFNNLKLYFNTVTGKMEKTNDKFLHKIKDWNICELLCHFFKDCNPDTPYIPEDFYTKGVSEEFKETCDKLENYFRNKAKVSFEDGSITKSLNIKLYNPLKFDISFKNDSQVYPAEIAYMSYYNHSSQYLGLIIRINYTKQNTLENAYLNIKPDSYYIGTENFVLPQNILDKVLDFVYTEIFSYGRRLNKCLYESIDYSISNDRLVDKSEPMFNLEQFYEVGDIIADMFQGHDIKITENEIPVPYSKGYNDEIQIFMKSDNANDLRCGNIKVPNYKSKKVYTKLHYLYYRLDGFGNYRVIFTFSYLYNLNYQYISTRDVIGFSETSENFMDYAKNIALLDFVTPQMAEMMINFMKAINPETKLYYKPLGESYVYSINRVEKDKKPSSTKKVTIPEYFSAIGIMEDLFSEDNYDFYDDETSDSRFFTLYFNKSNTDYNPKYFFQEKNKMSLLLEDIFFTDEFYEKGKRHASLTFRFFYMDDTEYLEEEDKEQTYIYIYDTDDLMHDYESYDRLDSLSFDTPTQAIELMRKVLSEMSPNSKVLKAKK